MFFVTSHAFHAIILCSRLQKYSSAQKILYLQYYYIDLFLPFFKENLHYFTPAKSQARDGDPVLDADG